MLQHSGPVWNPGRRGSGPLAAIITLSSVRFCLSCVYELAAGSTPEPAAGWLGLLIAALSFYAGVAFMLEDLHHRTALPIGHRGEAHQTLVHD